MLILGPSCTLIYYNLIIKNKKLMSCKKKNNERPGDDEDYIIYTDPNRRRRFTKKYIASGAWSLKENQIYLGFLQSQQKLFENQFIRRSSKVFRKMSSLLRRRDPEQCRSHHQKLGIRFDGDIQMIIDYLRRKTEKMGKKPAELQEQFLQKEKNNSGKPTKLRTTIPGMEDPNDKIDQFKMTCTKEGAINIIICLDDVQSW